MNFSINFRQKLYSGKQPWLMGILNITPDSFYTGSRMSSDNNLLNTAERMLNEGADILDIGGYSSRPGARDINTEEELKRVITAISLVVKNFPHAIISVDTFRSNVAKAAVDAGAAMINDISGGSLDKYMFNCIAKLNVPYVLMHMRGTPQNMQEFCNYNDVVKDTVFELSEKLEQLKQHGIKDIIIDPGIGFAKNIAQNFEIIKNLEAYSVFKKPLMVGISRKSFIYKTLLTSPEHALNGTTVMHTVALLKGANILRVHDVKEARECITLVEQIKPALCINNEM